MAEMSRSRGPNKKFGWLESCPQESEHLILVSGHEERTIGALRSLHIDRRAVPATRGRGSWTPDPRTRTLDDSGENLWEGNSGESRNLG